MTASSGVDVGGPATTFRDVAVIGGGCYGSFYATQLATAAARDKLRARSVLIVDRDPACQAARTLAPHQGRTLVTNEWNDFLDGFLAHDEPADGEPDDAIVPSPLMPHLMAAWLERQARARWPAGQVRRVASTEPFGTPYEVQAPDGTRYISFADWLCPTHCVEPLTCPVIRGPRTWEMEDAVRTYADRLARTRPVAGAAVFRTRHRAFGVGMFDVAGARTARRVLDAAAGAATTLVVGTISSCHGAVSLLELGPGLRD